MRILIFSAMMMIFTINTSISQIPNFRIHPSANAQIEPAIVRHPENPLIMFAAAYTISNSFRSEGNYFTTDGGISWFGSDTCNTGSSTSNHGGDPGPVIDKDGHFILTHQGGFIVGMYSSYSTNFGTVWSNNYQIASGDQDKGSPGTDDIATSPFYGRTYLVWTKFLNPFPIVSSYTSNGGESWTANTQINSSPSGYISLGAEADVNLGGVVYVCWSGVLTTSPQNEKFCGFAKSTNGGVNWSVNENIYAMNGVKTSSLSPWNIRINGYPHIDADKSGGERNGWIYIVTGEKNLSPAGTDPDVVFHRSSDGGDTWSSGVRVNQDPINNGKVQYFPAINVDEFGGINVIYYDNRNITSDSMDVYLSRSTDGGNSWNDFRINENRFLPKTVSGSGGSGNQGDNIGITSAGKKLWPVWMDDHTGIYQIWTAPVNIDELSVNQISQSIPEKFSLSQNYPNPFNPATNFEFGISEPGFVSVKVYNISGKEVAVLVNEYKSAGKYSVSFDGSNLVSGIYYYKMESGNFNETKRMVLLK